MKITVQRRPALLAGLLLLSLLVFATGIQAVLARPAETVHATEMTALPAA